MESKLPEVVDMLGTDPDRLLGSVAPWHDQSRDFQGVGYFEMSESVWSSPSQWYVWKHDFRWEWRRYYRDRDWTSHKNKS